MDSYLEVEAAREGLLERASQDLEIVIEKGNRLRAEFIRKLSTIGLPKEFRVIDCKSTSEGKKVVLRDWHELSSTGGYTAVSHTFGMDVYSVFNCECTSTCFAKVPRCSRDSCPGRHDERHWKTVGDILKMCEILMAAGAEYVWHDGVCIAQHDEAQVMDAIQHMGWIYANAKDTIIFLHYVGSPMAPIRHEPHPLTGDLGGRWHTRVWTLQEASVSTRRRYCVRVGGRNLRHCNSLQEFEDEIANLYKDDSTIAVVEEMDYYHLLLNLKGTLTSLLTDAYQRGEDIDIAKIVQWMHCISGFTFTLIATCFIFPTGDAVLSAVSGRDSKHEGDRINSILALAQVSDFVVPKDPDSMETWTIEFFNRQGQRGLALAVFSVNIDWEPRIRARQSHSWVPNLSIPLSVTFATQITDYMQFKVLSDGRIRLTGNLASAAVQFTCRSDVNDEDEQEVNELQQRQQEGVLAMDLRYVRFDPRWYTRGGFKAFAQGSSVEWGVARLAYNFTTSERFPVIEGDEIQNGESFRAELVFPAAGLQFHPGGRYINRNPDSIPVDWRVPALLVRGQLQSQVVKLGFFELFPELRDFLQENPILVTLLHELVIV